MINKRLVILISIILGILFLTTFILWLLFRTSPEEPIIETETPPERVSTPITSQTEEEFSIFKLSASTASSPAISSGKVLYYLKQNGNILETDFEGKTVKTISNISIPALITGIWSPDKSQVINIYEEGGEVKKAFLNLVNQKASALDKKIKFVNFSQSKNKIIYQFIDDSLGINKIATSDPDGLNWQNIFNVRMQDIRIYWPQDNLVAIITAPSGLTKGTAFTKKIDDQSSGLNKIIDGLYGLTLKYSPDGSRLIYSQTDQYGHNPSLHLLKNTSPETLNFKTLTEKCVFSKTNNLYCAVPRLISGSLVLPDDYYKDIATFSDIFFKVDSSGNRSTTILDPKDFNYDFNADDLQISDQEDYLIFVNKKDGLLYSIKLK